MKKLIWNAVDDVLPSRSGHYLVCSQINAFPRVAYCDLYPSGCDWFETVNWKIAHEIAFNLFVHCMNTLFEDASISDSMKRKLEKRFEESCYECAQEEIDNLNPNLDLLSDSRYCLTDQDGDDIEYWCEIPIAPLWGVDESVYASSEVGAQELLAAIEPVIKSRLLGDFKQFSFTPPWMIGKESEQK